MTARPPETDKLCKNRQIKKAAARITTEVAMSCQILFVFFIDSSPLLRIAQEKLRLGKDYRPR
jgi:hypothetical protein